MVKKAYPGLNNQNVMENLKLEHFIKGLPFDLASMVRIRRPKNMEEALRFSEICEVDKGGKKNKEVILITEVGIDNKEENPKKENDIDDFSKIYKILNCQLSQAREHYLDLMNEIQKTREED